MKQCTKCTSCGPFPKSAYAADGLGSWCKQCIKQYQVSRRDRDNELRRVRHAKNPSIHRNQHRNWRLVNKYNITPERWEHIFEAQDRKCAICRGDDPKGQGWQTDHDHKCCPGSRTSCGKCIRGILCNLCNALLGYAKDSSQTLTQAASYLNNNFYTDSGQDDSK